MKQQTIRSDSPEKTFRIGQSLAAELRFGQVVALSGQLGAGKTVLAHGIAYGLGIREPVTSPTFTVVQEYRIDDEHWLFHLDMYRIGNEEEALAFGIDDYLFCSDGITLIEWPERIEKLLKPASTQSHPEGRPPISDLLRIELQHRKERPECRQLTVPAHLDELR